MNDNVTQQNGGTNGSYGFVDTSIKTIENISDKVLPIWSSYLQVKQQKDQLNDTTYKGDPSSQNLNSPTVGNARQSMTDDKTLMYAAIGVGVVGVALIAYLAAK